MESKRVFTAIGNLWRSAVVRPWWLRSGYESYSAFVQKRGGKPMAIEQFNRLEKLGAERVRNYLEEHQGAPGDPMPLQDMEAHNPQHGKV